MERKIGNMHDPTGRALQLLSLLQTHKFWPGAELAERLEVSSRTLRRDVDRLRELGYPVDATPGADGGYRLAAGSHMPPLLLDDDEAVAIAVGLRSAAGASVAGIEEISLRALAKLEQVLPDRLRRRVTAVHGNISQMTWPGRAPAVNADVLALLAQACRDSEQVRFDYQRRDGDDSRRLVEPHQLLSSGSRWYVVAWDARRDDWRTFRLDRLRDPQLAGVRFRPRDIPGGNAAEFVRQSIGAMPRPHTATVVALGPVEAVRGLVSWSGAEVAALDGGRTLVHIRAESAEDVDTVAAVLASRFDVTVEDPPELGPRLAAVARRLRAASRS
jgi:predicted DNA-binding transcriptional regulator YafY